MATEAQDHTNRLNTPHSQKFLVIPSITLFLCALVPLWLGFLPSTSVENALQIDPFMQNKANFQKSQMNVNPYNTTDYENKSNWTLGESKPNSNPIKANFRKAKMNVTTFLTKEYENISNCSLFENKPNTKPIQTQTKPTCSELAEPISEAKKCCSTPFFCGISKEKMIFCNLINRKYQFNIIAGRMSNNKTI